MIADTGRTLSLISKYYANVTARSKLDVLSISIHRLLFWLETLPSEDGRWHKQETLSSGDERRQKALPLQGKIGYEATDPFAQV